MAFCELKYFSPALQKATAASIILPEITNPGPYATLYLLHGLSDDHTIWQRRTSIERYVQGLPLIVVMPDGGRGFYTDAVAGMAWETAIVTDLVNYVDKVFNTKADNSARCISGLSMGGYGALKLALRHPDIFSSAASHSGAMGFSHWPLKKDAWGAEMKRIVGENATGGPHDLYALTEQLFSTPGAHPAIKIDCGTEDFLLQDNRAFREHLLKLNIPHVYDEYPGAHEWQYWDTHVQESIAFHVDNLKLAQ